MSKSLIELMRQTAAIKPIPVDVPVWGRVYVRRPTVAEVSASIGRDTPQRLVIALGIAQALCDADGVRLLDPDSSADLELIASQPWEMLNEIQDAIASSDVRQKKA